MLIRGLTWCGVELEAEDGSTAVIDLLEDLSPLESFFGAAQGELADLPYAGRAGVAAVTHLHRNHADAGAIICALAPDGVLLRPPAMTGVVLEVAGIRAAEQELSDRDIGALALGPVDVAFLPISGALGDFPHRQPASGLPGTMTPEQAAAAMRAAHVVPIHYGLFDHPPHYRASGDAEPRLLDHAAARGITVSLPPFGQQLEITPEYSEIPT